MGKESQASDAAQGESRQRALPARATGPADGRGPAQPRGRDRRARGGSDRQVLKDLQLAEKDLDKLQQTWPRPCSSCSSRRPQVGKDLAEQLEKGQAEAAAETLQKMINQLKVGRAHAGTAAGQLMDEVDKAVSPARSTARCGDLPQERRSARCSRATSPAPPNPSPMPPRNSQDLMEQLGDAQDLKATLDALKRAQMCVGNGTELGPMPGPAPAGFKPGGKPGRGVGTWADEGELDGPGREHRRCGTTPASNGPTWTAAA